MKSFSLKFNIFCKKEDEHAKSCILMGYRTGHPVSRDKHHVATRGIFERKADKNM